MMARFALHAGRADVAKVVLDAIGRLHGGLIDNDIANLRAGLAAADGRVTDALTLYGPPSPAIARWDAGSTSP